MNLRLFSIIIFAFPGTVVAQIMSDESEIAKTTESGATQSEFLEKLTTRHDKWSSQLERTVRHIDAFFADDRAYEDANLLGFSYRHRMYRKWLFAEVNPAVGFE